MYQHVKTQPGRLGRWETRSTNGLAGLSGLGSSGNDASGLITSIGNAINNITSTIVQGQVARKQISAERAIQITTQVEATKQLDITTKGITAQSAIEVQKIGTLYGSIANIILYTGGVLSLLLLVGGLTYSKVRTKV